LAEGAHVIRDSDTTFKVKRSKVKVTRPLYSSPCWRVRQLQRRAWERVVRGKLLLRCRLLGGERRFGAHWGRGAGHIVAAARLQLVCNKAEQRTDIAAVCLRLTRLHCIDMHIPKANKRVAPVRVSGGPKKIFSGLLVNLFGET